MKNDEIRQANRKALPKFILSMTIFMLVGGAAGYLSVRYGLDRLTGGIKSAGEFFGAYIAPWLMLAIAVIMPIVCGSIQRRVKRMIDSWDGEDEDDYGIIDRKISLVGWLSGSALIVSDFLMAASYSKGFKIFESTKTTALFFVAVASVFAVIIEMMIIGQKCVDFAKRMNPEKKASFYDAKFSKKKSSVKKWIKAAHLKSKCQSCNQQNYGKNQAVGNNMAQNYFVLKIAVIVTLY